MENEIRYPLYAVRQGDGFACTGGTTDKGQEILALALFSSLELAARYADHNDLEPHFAKIRSPNGLRDFVEKMHPDVVAVAFDLTIADDGTARVAFSEGVDELITRLPEIAFTWDYPLYVLEVVPGAFASINGTAADGSQLVAVAVFTDSDLAARYRDSEEPAASIRPLNDAEAFARFLKLCQPTSAVTFDLTKSTQGSIAKHCVNIDTLLRDLPEL